ncbi:DUF3348 domain-containing protein [Dyella sp. C9]|uniref:DUF3348 domain-containing protein n=1 Tax=Dyella sp. C9 TaxID=2202154 RepID=UPI000DEFE483|nr:DUF3348 domain-containing protein [Dyella sp. C9]
MVQAPPRTTVHGPTFVRLLARLADVEVAPSRQTLSDRLSQWLDWTHAIALSTALDGRPASAETPAFGSAEEDECARVRAALAQSIVGPRDAEPAADLTSPEAIDYAPFRQRYLAMQRSMQAATGNLRGRLRDLLAASSRDMARLAEVDAVMERALSPREQTLLASVPGLLGKHFDRLRDAAAQVLPGEAADPQAMPATAAWLEVFRKDMQSVLLAELDVRFQPVEGLLAALRTR